MPAKSMTGYGRGEAEADGRIWTVELRCVNNRYLDLKMKLPNGYAEFEDLVRKKVGLVHNRGRVDLLCSVTGGAGDMIQVQVNLQVLGDYRKGISLMAAELGIEDQIDLGALSRLPDVWVRQERGEDLDMIRPQLEAALDRALEACDSMRCREGAALVMDLIDRLAFFEQTLAKVEASLPDLLQQRQAGLEERLAKLLDNVQLDPQRLAQEVAILADKTDVTEELVRLKSHIQQFRQFVGEDGQIGKKLDFLLQEFLREVNTIASKISDAAVAHLIVDLKGELEKIREQVQNIE